MIQKSTFLIALAALGAGILIGEGSSWLQGTTEQKFETLAGIQPGLGTVMVDYSTRAGNMYYAAQAGNWGFAAYQLKEMTEMQEVAEITRPGKAQALKSFEKASLVPLARDIESQNHSGFQADFKTMVARCNGCHQSNGMGFLVYQVPDRPATPAKMEAGSKLSRTQLHTLLVEIEK